MNLIFAASLWASRGSGDAWASEFPALARRNALFLWDDLPAGAVSPVPADVLPLFGARVFKGEAPGTLRAEIETRGLSRDETALVAAAPEAAGAARVASIPCFFLTGPEAVRAGGENLFDSVDAIVEAVWKVNTVERHLFPVVTVGGLIVDDGGDALLVRTRKWSGRWGIPGGKVDYGETLEQGFRREIREETGLELTRVDFALTQEAVEHPQFFRKRHFVLVNFFARVAGRHPSVRLNHEGEEYFWGPPAAALDSTERPLNGPTRVLMERYLEGKP